MLFACWISDGKWEIRLDHPHLPDGNAIFCGEFLDLAFGDIQKSGNIGDGKGVRPPVD